MTTKVSLEEYLARFPAEKVSTCFSYGSHTARGREGSYYCANCNRYAGEAYENDRNVPMKNEEEGHCWVCLEENVNDY